MKDQDTENEDLERDPPEDDGRHEVDLEAGADDAEDEGGEEEGAEGARPTRAERRAERGRIKQERDELREQNRQLSERVAKMEGALETSMRDTRARAERTDDGDPLQAEYNGILDEQETLAEQIDALNERYKGKIPEAQMGRLRERARQLDLRKHEIAAERTARRNAPAADPMADQKRAFQMAYSDVFADPAAKEYARGEFSRLVHHPNPALRKPNNQATLKLAMENTRKEFGMSRPAPTETERARTSGVSRGGTGGGNARSSIVGMGAFEKGLADKAFPHIKKDEERWNKWANTAGRKMLERKQKAKAAGGKR